ncbi:helix-turn-helix transcriptional regulator [Methanolobus halotolerans]|nr:winged helix-turn-helix domain-containing protein [Methanolobus halotolerans]
MSEKRKNMLLHLQDGKQEMEFLLKSLKTTRQALLPQIKILEENHLVNHYEDIYELTTIGKLVVDNIVPLLNTLEVFETDIDYWGTHDISFIPPKLFNEIYKIRKLEVVNPSITDIYRLNEKVWKTSSISKSHRGVITFFHPSFHILLSDLISNNVETYLIMPPDVIDTFKSENSGQLEKFMESGIFHLFVYNQDLKVTGIACNDYYFFMRQFKTNGEFDVKYVLSDDKDALEWGKELFEYYLEDSIPITDI